ncbi:hypothetical protein SLS58_002992 [Diplodia intermedia]|uniref:Nephrocystin 3-like N-terminal domain-containing protein n=1 Tax=Diplodia intermedia TaxID=856260 RepID=A0ABR3TYB6_9PEZI
MDKVTLYDLRVLSTLCNGYSATRSHVRALVTKAWPQLPEHTINIHTLDFDSEFPDLTPGIPQLMIATLSLETPPSTLLPPSDTSVTVTDKTGKLYHLQLTLKPDVVTLTEKQKACLQQLSFPHQNYREADIELAEGSCDWIIHHDSFRAWPEAPRKLLWVCGPSGAGKSTAMKRITQHLRSEHGRLVLSYFFDGRPSFIHNSREGCYRHLLTQMLPHEFRYTTELERMWKRLSDPQVVKDSSNSMADFLRVRFFGFLPSIAEKIPVTFVIDGLEEAGAMDMVKDFLATTHGSKLDVRLCISCYDPGRWASNDDARVDVELHNRDDIRNMVYQRMRRFGEQEEQEGMKLEQRIEQKAAGSFQWARVVADEIARLKRAGLEPPALEKRLENIPNDLPQLYRILMEDVDAEENSKVQQLFQCLCFAKRPLSTAELQNSCAPLRRILDAPYRIEESSRGLIEVKTRCEQPLDDALEQNKIQFLHHSIPYYLLDGGLSDLSGVSLHSTGITAHVQILGMCLGYLTKQDVLEEKQARSKAAEILLRIDASLTSGDSLTSDGILRVSEDIKTVARVWNLDLQGNHNLSTISDLSSSKATSHLQETFSWLAKTIARQTRERFPFADYLVSSLDYHLRELDDAGVPLPSLVDYSFWSPEVNYFKTWRYLSIALHPHNKLASIFDTSNPISRPTGATTLLHYIVEHSFLSSIQPALASFSPAHLSLHDATGHTPLTTAIMTRNFTLATALVANPKINPNIPDTTPTRHTPLIHAIRLLSTRHVDDDAHANGMDASKALLTTLLANPLTDPSLRDTDNRTPLSHAAQMRSISAFTAILDTVIAAGAAATHNPTDGDGDIAKIINEQDAAGRTPLSYAAEAASAGVVERLLSLSARTDLHDARGMTALDYAVRTEDNRWGVGRVVGLLLGAQAIRNNGVAPIEPKAVLEWAVEGGRVGVVRSVLDEERSRGLYLDDGLLERVREMAGAKNEGDQQPRRVYVDWSGEDGARQWLREYLPEVERRAGNMNEIKRMMEERRRKKLKEEQLEKAKAGVRVSSKL